jgi:2-phospho-L-lactate guanylyltransferase
MALHPIWAVVPAKSLVHGKSRLRPVLADAERARFARSLLEHTLRVLRASPIDGVLVATDGDDVADLAIAHGARVRRDEGKPSLAGVVDASLAEVEALGARSALVLMADLPRMGTDDVAQIVSALGALGQSGVAIVRDHQGRHTNALALSPPTALRTCFGRPDSFAAHCAAALAAGLTMTVVTNERLAFDVDAPADHAMLRKPPPEDGT